MMLLNGELARTTWSGGLCEHGFLERTPFAQRLTTNVKFLAATALSREGNSKAQEGAACECTNQMIIAEAKRRKDAKGR